MALMRSMLLAASQNVWLREHAVNYPFVRRSVSRFMPGESLEAALAAAQVLHQKNIDAMFTHLGENVNNRDEALNVTQQCVELLFRIRQSNLRAEVSLKLTQLGLDLSPDFCCDNLLRIVQSQPDSATIWVDMEASRYVDATLDIYKRALKNHPNVGICLQSYLRRTPKDLADLLPLHPVIRLVKGAYREPSDIAFPKKLDVDKNFFLLAQEMLRAQSAGECARAAFGTHDLNLIRQILDFAARQGYAKSSIEVQMLYGIQRAEQERLALEGYRSLVLVVYGSYWYSWFVRRLAERPANLWFMLRNIFSS